MPAEGLTAMVRRTIRASPERVFAAWTTPAQLQQWWGPGPVVCPEAHVDAREGGAYRIANRLPDGRITWIHGTFTVVRPPHELVFTWGMDDAPADERVSVRLIPRDGGTDVVVFHERIPNAQAQASHEAGWAGCMDGLDAFMGGSGLPR